MQAICPKELSLRILVPATIFFTSISQLPILLTRKSGGKQLSEVGGIETGLLRELQSHQGKLEYIQSKILGKL